MQRRTFLTVTPPALLSAHAGLARARADKPRIKIGQIGVGHAHTSKLGVYRRSADYEVVGIVEPNEALRKRVENQPAYQGLPWMTREELLNVPGLQAVLVETEVRDLLANAEVCVNAGLHVHIDKPAGESLPHFRRILESARRHKRMVQLGYMYRYNPAVRFLHECLSEGWLGDLFEVHAVMGKVVSPGERKSLLPYRGGIMFELGCHVLDLVIKLLGASTQVTGHNQHIGPPNDGYLDSMLGVFTYPKAIATVKANAVEVEGFSRRHLVACGTAGTLHIQPLDNPTATLALDRPRGKYRKGVQTVTFPKYERYVGDAADMAAVIRGESAFAYPPEHDMAVQAALLRACQLPVS